MSAPDMPDSTLAPSPERTLRRLFLTLFLRGRSSRGLKKETAPKSVSSKLAFTLVMYALVGLVGLTFMNQPVFALSLYLHAMTLVFLGMFVAASAGEVLFNKEEADILMHRPVTPQAMLWAKISVLVQVSLWLAGAFNLAGLLIGIGQGGWRFPVAHALSTALEALFCTSCVVLVYQLCLRWFGLERLDGLMTTAQVLVTVAAVAGGQLAPQLLRVTVGGKIDLGVHAWWIGLLPPAWFAGFDDALAGVSGRGSWALAGVGLAATTAVVWLSFGRLARDYEHGLQTLNETTSPRIKGGGHRWLDILIKAPPLCWWLRDSVARAAFRLTAAYLLRDRDVKLRLYPGLAPMLVMPIGLLVQDRTHGGLGGFGVAFAGGFLGLMPLLGVDLLRYSQQWQAADLFRAAPLRGPAPLCHGARRAVLCFLAVPTLAVLGLIAWLIQSDGSRLPLLLPGVIVLPVYAMIPCLGGKAVPLSLPTEEAKAAARVSIMMVVMLTSCALSALATWAWTTGWFNWLLLAESGLAIGVYLGMRASLASVRWPPLE